MQHIVVDGSNIATEGRSMPSLQQLDEAVRAFKDEHPEALITVVVDATFGHRIDPKEVAEFDEAVANNELVAPPAGAVGRGDAFVLSIAHKVGASILSNDSYQEFHGQYAWLFDEGRLIGGKPVPHVGWVFVDRLPVRGPLSRKAFSDAKRKGRGPKVEKTAARPASAEASQPMPVPASPPPNATLPRRAKAAPPSAPSATPAAPAAAGHQAGTNDLLPYLSFVERHPLGTAVAAVIDRYSSHGAYVTIDDVVGYLPLRLMADPPPRSAREFVQLGETMSLVVESYAPQRRSIDLAIPNMATARPPGAKKPRKAAKQVAAAPAEAVAREAAAAAVVPDAAPPRRSRRKAAAAPAEPATPAAAVEAPAPTPTPAKRTRKKAAAAVPEPETTEVPTVAAPASEPPVADAVAAKPRRSRKKAAPPEVAPPTEVAAPEPAAVPAKRTRKATKAAAAS